MNRSVRYSLFAAALALVTALLASTSSPVIATDTPDLVWCDKTSARAMNREQAETCAALWAFRKELAQAQRREELRLGYINGVRVLRGSDPPPR